VRRTGLGVVAAGGLALAAFTWWPNGEYQPIQPGEKGTLASGVEAILAVPSGRPALTSERQAELGGAPTVRERGGDFKDPRRRNDEKPAQSAPADEQAPSETTTTPDATQPAPGTEPAPAPPAETVPQAAPVDPTTPTQTLPIDPATEPTP